MIDNTKHIYHETFLGLSKIFYVKEGVVNLRLWIHLNSILFSISLIDFVREGCRPHTLDPSQFYSFLYFCKRFCMGGL